jgi:hypothetical protein
MMLRNYKDLQAKHEIAEKIKEEDEEGLQTTFQDLLAQINSLEKQNFKLNS